MTADAALSPRAGDGGSESDREPRAVFTGDLRRTYGDIEAVRGLDLDVAAGETFGFLGPNGAGKTTTIAMLCTLLRPTAGFAEVAGVDVVRRPEEVRRRIGVVFQEPTVDRDLTAEQNLRFHAELYGIPRREVRTGIARLLEAFGLGERSNSMVGSFSGGMQRRLEMARVLMHRPQVLFLDEPTAGLDPHGRAQVWQHLHDLRTQAKLSVFLSTHYLEEAENCDRIAVMDQGRVVAEGTPEELKSAVGSDVVWLQTEDDQGAARLAREIFGLDAVAGPDGVRVHTSDGAHWVPRLCAQLTRVRAVSVIRPSLDDVFSHYAGRSFGPFEPPSEGE